jgi:transposase
LNKAATIDCDSHLDTRCDEVLCADACRQLFASLQGQLADANEEIRLLKNRVASLLRTLFGRRCERISLEELGQCALFDRIPSVVEAAEDLEVEKPDQNETPGDCHEKAPNNEPAANLPRPKIRRPNHPGRTKLSPTIERVVDRVIGLPEDESFCCHCASKMEVFDVLIHEEVDHVPEKLVIRQTICQKAACKCCKKDAASATLFSGGVHEASGPTSRAGASLMANLIEAKCDDALPVHRQQQRLARLGFFVPCNTLYGYWNEALDLCAPVAEAVVDEVLATNLVGVDDTKLVVIQASKKRTRSATTKKAKGLRTKGCLWCLHDSDGNSAFIFTESWAAKEVAPVFKRISGFIQCDDDKGYSSKVIEVGDTKRELVSPNFRLGCGMHIRRKFEAAFRLGDPDAKEPLRLINEIYAIEDSAKENNMTYEQRFTLRQCESISVLDRFYKWVEERLAHVGHKSPLAKAVRYAWAQRDFWRRCFTDGRFEIDNGRCERTLRKPALGRKNYLFAGSIPGAKRLATAYTLVMSCRALGICTRDYLIDVLTKLRAGFPDSRAAELTPRAWAIANGKWAPSSNLVARR